MPYLDRIWRLKSSFELEEQLTADEVFQRLEPLFQTQGTEFAVQGHALTYLKTNPAAQDKLATFTAGTIVVDRSEDKTRLSYDLTSTALFLCFLAPLAFLAFAQFVNLINALEKPGLVAEQAVREQEKADEDEEEEVIRLHWIDELLGAPAPKQPGEEDEEDRQGNGRSAERSEDEVEPNHSPETAYAFAGIFSLIYLVGRILEPHLLKRTLRAALTHTDNPELLEKTEPMEASAKLVPQGRGPSKK
ncbi:MAG: hypothetical protein AAF650_00420 [Pseudomonadota bacterium]